MKPTLLAMIATVLAASSLHADWTTFDSTNDADSDDFVGGEILTEEGGQKLADWNLSTTVSNTDFANLALHGGDHGLEYVMLNEVANSTDVNSIQFVVEPLHTLDAVQLSVSQSAYADDLSWNGGDSDTSRFILSWNDTYGMATVLDPENQLSLEDGLAISSNQLIQFSSNRAYNSQDAWSIQLPEGAAAATVEWSSANPSGGSTLTREWVTFEANVTAVPEPSSSGLLALVTLAFAISIRKRRNRCR